MITEEMQIEMLGSILASDCNWRGDMIMKAFCAALTDAHFHSELRKILPTLNEVFGIKKTNE